MIHAAFVRPVAFVATLALALAGLAVTAAPALAVACPSRFEQDIDGDAGAEVVAGVPDRSNGTGAVDIHYSNGTTALITAATLGLPSRAGDRFGSSVAVRDLNHDECADVVIGASGSGAVYVAFGSPTGLRLTGVASARQPQPASGMGASVTTFTMADPSNPLQEWVMVAAGAPRYDVGATVDAGAVVVHRLQADGTLTRFAVVTQDSPGIGGGAEAGDRFGEVLQTAFGAALLVGSPREDVGSAKDAGSVTLVRPDPDHPLRFRGSTTTQDSPGVPGAAETGDRFGASLACDLEVLVGAPGEDVGSIRDAGLVHLFRISDARDALTARRVFHQDSPGIPGATESGDGFGAGVAYVHELLVGRVLSAAVGAPGEDLGSTIDAGSVTIVDTDVRNRDDTAPFVARSFTQGSGVPGVPETGDRFGAALWPISGDYLDDEMIRQELVIGVPGEDVGRVADAGSLARVTAREEKFTWRAIGFSRGPAAGNRYGSVATRL